MQSARDLSYFQIRLKMECTSDMPTAFKLVVSQIVNTSAITFYCFHEFWGINLECYGHRSANFDASLTGSVPLRNVVPIYDLSQKSHYRVPPNGVGFSEFWKLTFSFSFSFFFLACQVFCGCVWPPTFKNDDKCMSLT